MVREQADKETQLVIPAGLQAELIHLAHDRHQGPDQTIGLLRQTCWFPDMGDRVKEFMDTCHPC